jgi:hypothetical protein
MLQEENGIENYLSSSVWQEKNSSNTQIFSKSNREQYALKRLESSLSLE